MIARDIFAQAKGSTINLFGGEATVSRVPGLGTPHRVWFGFDNENLAVAYFECLEDKALTFSVSEAILVKGAVVDDEHSGDRVATIKVSCLDRKLIEVFYGFMDDVIAKFEPQTDVLQSLVSAAAEWRSLLQIASSPFSESRAIGLYGELRFLEEAINELGPSALDLWQRSERDVHDFIANDARVEVKCSSFQDRATVTIHGLRQLQPPIKSTLTLAVAEMQKHGSESIDDVLARIIAMDTDLEKLNQKLLLSKYVMGMPSAGEYKFDLLSWRFWEITAGLSVLNKSAVEEHIANAVSSVSYALNLSAIGVPKHKFDFQRLSSMVEVEL